MKTGKSSYWLWLPAFVVFCALPAVVFGASSRAKPQAQVQQAVEEEPASDEIPPGQRLGAPQVLEIAPVPEQPEEESVATQPPSALPTPPAKVTEYTEPPIAEKPVGRELTSPQLPASSEAPRKTKGNRNYLGVLYATAEEGPVGVKVLDVVPGSPADRAGFAGVNRPSEGQSDLMKAAIVVLAMSPAGPFVIPLAIAHDMYRGHRTPGDLIVAVNNQPVKNAQEFSEMMRHYQPHETVAFSVLRGGKAIQISVQLEEEPS